MRFGRHHFGHRHEARGEGRSDHGWGEGEGRPEHGCGEGRRFMRGMRGEGRGFGGRHGGRMFEHGDLRLVILALIAEKPSHGYELIKAIEDKLAGAYAPSPGVVYPTLTMLEELGHAVVANAEGGKKLYAATDEGRAFLAANQPAVDAIFARITEATARMGGGRSPQLMRAMENLRMALRLRVTSGPMTEEQLSTMVRILDDAARAVEQI